MKPSLSILFPVQDGQHTLAAETLEFLEIVPELTPDFEVVIIDDGSSDATVEVAEELTIQYPQVFVHRHRESRGRAAAICTAVERSRGAVLFLRDADCQSPLHEMTRMWQMAAEYEIVLGAPAGGPADAAGFQMISRQVAVQLNHLLHDRTRLIERLAQDDIPWLHMPLGREDQSHRSALEEKASAIARQILEGPRRRSMMETPSRAKTPARVGAPKFVRLSEIAATD